MIIYIIFKNVKNTNFMFIMPKVNTDYIRRAQVMNIDNLKLINKFIKTLMKT